MRKVCSFIILFLFLILPIQVDALITDNYEDVIAPITGHIKKEDTITIYLFHGDGCPHCADEQDFLTELKKTYSMIEVVEYEVWYNSTHNTWMQTVASKLNMNVQGVPFTVIGTKAFSGFSSTVSKKIENAVRYYLGEEETTADMEFGSIVEDARLALEAYLKAGGKEEDTAYEELSTAKREYEEAVMALESSEVKSKYYNTLQIKLEQLQDRIYDIPLLGEKVITAVSIPIIGILLGLLDGFNPCAMWILLFLINMLFHMKDKKKMWILGLTFLISSAFVYFLVMLGLKSLLSIFEVGIIQKVIATVAFIGGVINLRGYYKSKQDSGCDVVDEKKRKKIFQRIKAFTSEKSFPLALLGVILLAASVNVVELACSAGFPTIFISILELNHITGMSTLFYILLYVLFFLIDDIIIFVIAVKTLELTGISTKYNRLSHLIGGILMIIMGFLLVLKPEWLMFHF